jgi:peroxiredoxin
MKKFLLFSFLSIALISNAQIKNILPGEMAPDFTLKNVDNKIISYNSFPSAKGFIVVFTCNTCPVAKAYEQRVIDLHKKYAPQGYPVIAINANDPSVSSGDNFELMQVRAEDKKYSFPYLYDDGQKVTNQYGAKNTPTIFVVRKTGSGNTVEYYGAIDNDTEENDPNRIRYVEEAVNSLLKNEKPAVASTKAIGCSVKRKRTS